MKQLTILLLLICTLTYGQSPAGLWASGYFSTNTSGYKISAIDPNADYVSYDSLIANVTLQPNDSILFNQGESFSTSLSISTDSLFFSSYGTGSKPEITASKSVGSWTNLSGNIWYSLDTNSVYQVFKEETPLQNAKSARRTITSVTSTTIFVDTLLIGHYDLVGASILHYPNPYFIAANEITSFNSVTGEVTVTSTPQYPFTAGHGYEIINDIHELASVDDWVYRNDTLYVYDTGTPDSIYASANNTTGFVLNTGVTGITIDGLKISGFNNGGVIGTNVIGTKVKHCEFVNIYKTAVSFYGTSGNNNLVQSSTIDKCMMWAIYSQSDSLLAYSNTINNTGLEGRHTYWYAYSSVGVRADGDYSEVMHNTIENSGYNGVNFGGQYSKISYNYIDKFSQFLTDGGGVYTYSADWANPSSLGSVVEYNTIIGNLSLSTEARACVYLDNQTQDVNVQYNTLAYGKPAILMNNPRNDTILGNNIYDCRTGISLSELSSIVADNEVYGNAIDSNKVLVKDNAYKSNALIVNSGYSNTDLYTGDNNRYYNLGKTHVVDFYANSVSASEKTLAQWNTLSSQEANSIQNTTKTQTFAIATEGSTLISNGDFSSGTTGWSGSNGTIAVSGGYLTYTPTGASDFRVNTSANHPTLENGKKYLLQWDIKSTSGTEIEGGWRYFELVSPFNNNTNQWMTHPSSTWETYSQVFESDFDGSPSLRFPSMSSSLAFDLDNVSIKEVTLGDEPELSFLAYNETSLPKVVDLPTGIWQTMDSVEYSGTINIPAYSSTTLLKLPDVVADYYISGSVLASDLNDGLSQSTPVRTLDGLSAYTLLPADNIAIERGYEYTSDLSISTASTGSPIVFMPYGTGAKPVINNLSAQTGFTQNGNVYSKVYTGDEPRYLIFDGKPVKKGDWPDNLTEYFTSRALNPDFTDVTYSGFTSTLPDVEGTEVVWHANQWTYDVVPVVEQLSTTSIRVNVDAFSYKPEASVYDSLKFQNHPSFLEANGEWAYRNDTLYVYSTDDISNHTVEIPSGENTFTISGNADVIFKDIDIKGTNQTVFAHTGTGDLTITGSDIQFATEVVVGDMSGTGLYLDSLNLSDIFGRSFAASLGGQLDTIEWSNSTVNRAGLVKGYDKYNYRGYNGAVMFTYVQDLAKAYNIRMDSLGYNGISAAPLNNLGTLEVSYCYGTNTNINLVDGAFIHIGSQTDGLKWIHHNISKNAGRNLYHDFGGNNYVWEYNTSIEPSNLYGLYMNDPKNTYVRYNTFYGASENMRIQYWNDSTDLGYIHDLFVYDNSTWVKQDFNYGLYVGLGNQTLPDINWSTIDYGRQDSNIHVVYSLGQSLYRIRGGWGNVWDTRTTLAGMQALGWEDGSVEVQSDLPEIKFNPTLDSATVSFIGAEKTDQFGVVHTDSIRLAPFGNIMFVDSIGVQKITNGGFDDTSWWNNRDGDWTISGGVAAINLGFYSPLISGAEVFEYASPNKTFTITFDVVVTSGTLQIGYCNSDGSTFGEINNYTSSQSVSIEYVHSNVSLHYLVFYSQTGFNGSIDNVSVREKY